MQHLTGRTFSGIFEGVVEIKRSLIPNHIVIIHSGGILTVEDQIIESGSFDSAKTQVWPIQKDSTNDPFLAYVQGTIDALKERS